MKKLMIGVLSLVCVSCMAAAFSLQTNSVSAEEQEITSIFTETKCQISKTGDRMLVVTGITDVSKIYEMGYEISGGYQLQDTDVAETNMYYESLTLGGSTKTASEFIAGAEGLLIWEIGYNSAYTYSVQPYAYVGEFNGSGQLVVPDVEEKSYGAKKESFNLVTVTFVDEDGTTLGTQNVTIGGQATSITAPKKTDAEFEGWYVDDVKYDFSQAVKGNLTLTANYKYAANYSVRVETAQYAEGYTSPWYHPGALNYVDATSVYASYLGISADGAGKAMAGTTIDLTEAVENLPEGVKVSNDSVLTGVVEEDGSLELFVKLDIDEDYLGFKLSNIKLGDYGCNGLTFSLANINGVIGLEIKATSIGNGKSLYIDIDDVDKATTPSLVLNYYEKAVYKETRVAVADDTATYSSSVNLFGTANNTECYYGTSVDLFEKFPSVNKITEVKIQYIHEAGSSGPRDIFITGLKANDYAAKRNVEYTVDNGKLANMIAPLAIGTISQESHNYGSTAKNSIHYAYEDKEPGNQYYKVGVSVDLGGAIQVSNYESINVQFQTTAKKVADNSLNAGTLVYINGVNVTPGNGLTGTYYNGAHTADLIKLAKDMNIETIKTVELIHAQWGDRYDIHMYIASVSCKLAAGVVEDPDPEDNIVSESVTYSADNGNIMGIAKALGGVTLVTESNYKINSYLSNNLCYRHPDAVSGDTLPGEHAAGIIFNLGKIKVSDYETIKVRFRSWSTNSSKNGTVVYLNGASCGTKYGGAQEVDLKALAESAGISVIETLELACANWVGIPDYELYVEYIELVVAE